MRGIFILEGIWFIIIEFIVLLVFSFVKIVSFNLGVLGIYDFINVIKFVFIERFREFLRVDVI